MDDDHMDIESDLNIKDIGILSAVISTIVTSIVNSVMKFVPADISLLIFSIILSVIEIILFISWNRCRKLLITILPKDVIPIPVNGEEMVVTLYNRNKFDIFCDIKLQFPKTLEVQDKNERTIEEKYEGQITIKSMNIARILFKLYPEHYHEKNYIYYYIDPKLKIVNKILRGEIIAET